MPSSPCIAIINLHYDRIHSGSTFLISRHPIEEKSQGIYIYICYSMTAYQRLLRNAVHHHRRAAATVTSAAALCCNDDNDDNDNRRRSSMAEGAHNNYHHSGDDDEQPQNILNLETKSWSNNNAKHTTTASASNTPSAALNQQSYNHNNNIHLTEEESESETATTVMECDFVIIGHGAAGSAAQERLSQLVPSASILVIDPIIIATNTHSSQTSSNNNHTANTNNVVYINGAANAIHPSQNTLHCITSNSNFNKMLKIRYKHNCLIATGCRGAPPPLSLMDSGVLPRILELRSTSVPHYLSSPQQQQQQQQQRPVLPPQTLYQITQLAASEGANICILGSGAEALELAITAASISTSNYSNSNPSKKNNNNNNNNINTTLLCGTSAPLSHILPRYLSSAVTKRLKQHAIVVEHNSLIRYITCSSSDIDQKHPHSMEVFTAKAYDTMETQRHWADLIVGTYFMAWRVPSHCCAFVEVILLQ